MVVTATAEVGDYTGDVEATVEGDATTIAFNARYLNDVLSNVQADRFALELNGPSRRASSGRWATTTTCTS